MYNVYILQSLSTRRYYIGMTEDVERRLYEHNTGNAHSTRNKGPWKIVHVENELDRKSAWLRERQIKKYKGGEAFKKLIGQYGEVA